MSGGIAAIIAATSAASSVSIAAAAAAKKRKEEEDMAGYKKNDLDGWEFKFVRAHTNKFRTQEAVRKVCEEETLAGWELVEKFDDQRLRFKRRVERRSSDTLSDIDPYRTTIGFGGGKVTGLVVGVTILLVGVGLLVALYFSRAIG